MYVGQERLTASAAETGIIWNNQVNTMADDAVIPWVTRALYY